MDEFRVFLSAVTSEFGKARDALAKDLYGGEIKVREQQSFHHDGKAGTLLPKLHNYIEFCNVVVCLVGARSGGGFPTEVEAVPFKDFLPEGVAEASYTQWEFHFARRYKRLCLIYLADPEFERDQVVASPDDRPDLQAEFVAAIKRLGLQWTAVRDQAEFRIAVLKDLLHLRLPEAASVRLSQTLARVRGKPISLPYPSLGTRFKGRGDVMETLRRQLLAAGAPTAITARYQALHGLGGIGKTRAAVEYAWAHQADYEALLFAIAETPEAMASNLAALTGVLGLTGLDGLPEEATLNAVLDCLRAHPGCSHCMRGPRSTKGGR